MPGDPPVPVLHVTQEHREVLISDTTARAFRKKAREVAQHELTTWYPPVAR